MSDQQLPYEMTEVPLCGQVAREVLHPQAVGFRHRASVTADRTALTFMSDIVTSIPLPVPRHRDLAVEAACVSPSKGGPISDFDHAGRFGGLKDGALHFQRCRWCRTPVFRRVFCPACASDDLDLERSGGTGVVGRSLVVRRDDVPHNFSLVVMAEGFVLRGIVVGVACHAVRPGAWVRVDVDGAAQSPPWAVMFRPWGGPDAIWQPPPLDEVS